MSEQSVGDEVRGQNTVGSCKIIADCDIVIKTIIDQSDI